MFQPILCGYGISFLGDFSVIGNQWAVSSSRCRDSGRGWKLGWKIKTLKKMNICSIILLYITLVISFGMPIKEDPKQPPEAQVIHIFVALCDNKYQGIVPVPAKIGNGQDP